MIDSSDIAGTYAPPAVQGPITTDIWGIPKELTTFVSRRAQYGVRYAYFLLGCRRCVRSDLDRGRHLPGVGDWHRRSRQDKCMVILGRSVMASHTDNPPLGNLRFS